MGSEKDIYVVADLHWNIDAYYENLRFLDIVDEDWNRTGWDSYLYFLGDIIWDRHLDGIHILWQIEKLKSQARSKKGDVFLLWWNHDYGFVLYLTTNIILNLHKSSFAGLLELKKFAWEDYQKTMDINNLRLDKENIFKNIYNSREWKNLINMLKNYDLIKRYNDIIFLHTNPTFEILYTLETCSIEDLNNRFKKWIEKLLSGEFDYKDKDMISFFDLAQIFLVSNRRENIPDYKQGWIYDSLHKKGINYIINWHNWFWWLVNTMWNIKIIDIDYSFWKYQGMSEGQKSVARITKDWNIYIWAKQINIK